MHTAISCLVFEKTIYRNITSQLISLSHRIQENITVDNNSWDLTQYNADPLMPYPNGSSGFRDTLYIVTTDGFVIERNRPINGILDSSDFKTFLNYTAPTTINSSTNEHWRVLTHPIGNSQPSGAIIVSYYNPPSNTEAIDTLLHNTATQLNRMITITDHGIDVSQIDIRNVHYEVSFEIVNNFNIVLMNNGRTPSFVDPSYVANQLHTVGTRFVQDQNTREKFLFYSLPLMSKDGTTVGILVLAQSINFIHSIVRQYILLFLAINVFFALILTYLTNLIIKKVNKNKLKSPIIKKISFNKQSGQLHVNDHVITIPTDSNQYYFCKLLFAHPTKKWELDQIMDGLGDSLTKESRRKVYDMMLSINKKANIKLIYYQGKKISINPDYLPFISVN